MIQAKKVDHYFYLLVFTTFCLAMGESRRTREMNTLMVITGNTDHNARREIYVIVENLRKEEAVLTCGDIGDARSEFCHKYDPASDVWAESIKMMQRRSLSATVWVDQDGWWVTGGIGTRLSNSSSTEVYDANSNQFWRGPPLPESLLEHCLVQINATHFFVAGGETRPKNSAFFFCNHAWIYDHRTRVFTPMPSMPRKVTAASCGLVKNPLGETFIVVAGGVVEGQDSYTKHTNLFNLATLEWRNGPELPNALAAAPTVAFGDTFLLLGGYKYKTSPQDSVYSREIFEFEFYRKWWSFIFYPNTYYEQWVRRSEKLIYGSARFPVFWVPDKWC